MAKAQGLFLIAMACSLVGSASLADPLHKYGNEGAHRHEDSGWMIPKQVGSFTRVGQPYTIDGNSDIGVQYAQGLDEARVAAIVEVYAVDSAATDAKLENARTTAARQAGASARLQSEAPFELGARDDLGAIKVTFEPESAANESRTSLYFVTSERWIVKVLASTTNEEAGRTLDTFVRDLPWNTLGVDPGDLHHGGS